MKIAAFTGSQTISSRRFRILQYCDGLSSMGIQVDEYVARYGAWPPADKWKRPFWFAANIIDRIVPTIFSRSYDLTLLQREFISTFYTLERFTGRPRILDVDDAVWLINRRSDLNFKALVKSCDGVICGNEYIRQNLSDINSRAIVIPTAVDTDRFYVSNRLSGSRLIIGWSGLHAGAKYLLDIERSLFSVLKARPDVLLRIVSDRCPKFEILTSDMFEFVKWSPQNEVETIQGMDIGLMPLEDSDWSRGKCSYKMLLYMSCGIPVVVSPYGMNAEVLAAGKVGFGAISSDEWTQKLIFLIDNEADRLMLGSNARAVIEERYSLFKIIPQMADFLLSFSH